MSDNNQNKTIAALVAENRALGKRLRRLEGRNITMDWLQSQNMALLRGLMTDLEFERGSFRVVTAQHPAGTDCASAEIQPRSYRGSV